MRCAFALAPLMLLVAGNTVFADERVTNPDALVVRGMNGDECDPNNIGAGSKPKVGNGTLAHNVSVQCSPDGKIDVKKLRKKIKNPHVCWATLADLEQRNSNIIVMTNPIGKNNKRHCLVSYITPDEMVAAMHWQK